ncbi:MAG: acylase, partial [Saprospiraceae bacterium]|nr:acylase [Saprospiraceae bacterium]
YEVHLHSEEGLNVLGGSLPGFLSIGHGVNQYLGWAHTVNHPDFTDIYALEMHPTEKLVYRFDNQWDTLQVRNRKN